MTSGLVTFVENDRGLAFEEPVFVDFVPAAEFERLGASEVESLDAEEQRDLEQSIGLLRAIGLLEGEVDLLAKLAQLNAEGVLAFYDPQTERITVRGTELTEDVKGTLVHELTHVLQDQHFGLDRLEDDGSEWLRAVAEGDAERVAAHWVAHLDPAARKAHDGAAEAAGGDADLAGIPDVVMAFMGAPYEFGQGLVELLAAVGGNPAIDTDELGATPEQWEGSMPAGVAAVSRRTGLVEFTACDPGAGFVLGPSRLGDAVGYPLTRTWVGISVINEAHVPAEQARCYAGAVADQITPEQIASETAMSSRSTQRKLTRAAEACLS